METLTHAFKDRAYEQLARIGKAVASPQGLELLDLLSQGPRTVENEVSDLAGSRSSHRCGRQSFLGGNAYGIPGSL